MGVLIAAIVISVGLGAATVQALTVDEIIKLKRAGVSDSTIELLIKNDADRAKRAGFIIQNGWIVHTTDTRETRHWSNESYGSAYPIVAYPWMSMRPR